MRNSKLSIVSALVVLMTAATSRAAAPAVTALFPPGVQRGTSVNATLTGKPGTLPLAFWSDQPGLTFKAGDKPERVTVTAAKDARPGLYWIRVANADGVSEPLPFVVGLLSEGVEVGPGSVLRMRLGDAESAGKPFSVRYDMLPDNVKENLKKESVPLPCVVNGTLAKSAEVDRYRFQLKAGETLLASVQAQNGLASPMDAVLQIVSPDGFVLQQNDDTHGNDPQIVLTAKTAGEYQARLFAFPETPNSTINFAGGASFVYRLTLTTGPFVEFAWPESSAETSLVQGWNLPAGQPLPVQLPGRQHQLPVAQMQHSLAETTQPRAFAPHVTATLPVDVVGCLASTSAVHSLKLSAKKGQQLRLLVWSKLLESELDPLLTIQDDQGKTVFTIDDVGRENPDIDTTWKPPADGTFTLQLQDRYGHGGDTFNYRWIVCEQQPRVELTAAASHYELDRKSKKPLEIPVAVNRLAGHADELKFRIPDLPPGVTLQPATSAAKGDSAKKVTLKLELAADAQPFSGPIEIVATSAAKVAQQRLVTVPTKAAGERISTIWLTIPPK